MKVELVSLTVPVPRLQMQGIKTAEELIVYEARVSSPENQTNTLTVARLLAYCIENGHWSVFDQVDMTVEIETSRAIAAQILRHRSFCFQEFSQRYAKADMGFERYEARRQDTKNRQSSIDDLSGATKDWFDWAQESTELHVNALYEEALSKGIAKEQARMLLPLSTRTRLYMKGSVRSWIHYLQARTHASAQKEHRDVAAAIKTIFVANFPTVAEAVWAQEETYSTYARVVQVEKEDLKTTPLVDPRRCKYCLMVFKYENNDQFTVQGYCNRYCKIAAGDA